MKDTFYKRAVENISSAKLLFEYQKYNASANRAYYAAFHIAIAAIFYSGIKPVINHKSVNTMFSDFYFNRRKILSSKYKRYLTDLQDKRGCLISRKLITYNLLIPKLHLGMFVFMLI